MVHQQDVHLDPLLVALYHLLHRLIAELHLPQNQLLPGSHLLGVLGVVLADELHVDLVHPHLLLGQLLQLFVGEWADV